MTLNDLTIRALPVPATGQRIHFDDVLKGFGVRVSQGGAKTYVVLIGEKRRKVTIGRVGVVKLAAARDKARQLLAEYQLNGEPEPTPTFAEARETYLTTYYTRNRKSTQIETRRILEKNFAPFDGKELGEIGRKEVFDLLDTMKPSAANHAFTAIRAFLQWCVGRGYLEVNPLGASKKPHKPRERARVLTEAEIAATLTTAPHTGRYGAIVLFLLHTGQRRGQAMNLEGRFFHDELITWPSTHMKAGFEHTIPRGVIPVPNKQGRVFPKFTHWHKAHKSFLKATGTHGWTLHDLRRTFATRLAELGVAPHVVERLIAHRGGEIKGVAAVYNRAQYIQEMREALTLWNSYLSRLAAGTVDSKP